MNRDISLYLQDILSNMKNAETFVGNLSYEEFTNDMKTSYAVVRCLKIIGEAAKNVPSNIRRKHPEVPWKEMAGMRDKVIHFYFGVNPQKVWLVVKERIPKIKPLIEKVLEDIRNQQHGKDIPARDGG